MNRIISRSYFHGIMKTFGVLVFFLPALLSAQTNSDIAAIPQTLKVENCPPISLSLKNEFNSYLKDYYLDSVIGISADSESRKPIVLVKEMNNPVRLVEYSLKNSVATLNVKQSVPVLDTIYDLYPSPDETLYLFNADDYGDGQFQFYLYNPKTVKTVRLISDGRNVEPVWSPDAKKFVYGNAASNQEGMNLAIAELVTDKTGEVSAKTNTLLTTSFMLTAQDWSSDGNHLAYIEYFSNRNSSALWLIDLQTNEKRLIAPFDEKLRPAKIQTNNSIDPKTISEKPSGEVISAQFSADGEKLYFAANHTGDFAQVYSYDLAARQTKVIAKKIGFDVENFRLSPDGDKIAVVYDIDGSSRLFVSSVSGSQTREITLPAAGVVQNPVWSKDDKFLAFNFTSARLPAAIMSAEISKEGKLNAELVASSPSSSSAETSKFPKADPISWKADDGLIIKGWRYESSTKNNLPKDKRPVIIDIHGGPEDSARPEYAAENAYYLDALGAVVIYPNVRGSTGRGKSFLDADNALQRTDAVKDFGRLFDWIAAQPDLDSNRIMLRGFSYGGYMALLVAATYPNRIAAVAVEAAPTNLVSFLETTSGWRRAQRRSEYGDERLPKIRAGLEKIAPRNLTSSLRMPLLIAAGMRDPRVSATESEKFVSAVRSAGNKNVWSLFASDDGHGLTGENEQYRLLLAAEFFKKFVGQKTDSHKQNQNKITGEKK